jgi:hypothetical protein
MAESNTINMIAESTPIQAINIFEVITGITLTSTQTELCVKIIEDAGNDVAIRKFVDCSLGRPELKEFAESVAHHCLADNGYKRVFESQVAEVNLSQLGQQGN